jgi:hypothetical protein
VATPGDRREDHAQHAASLISAEYANAELMIIAAVAYCARKMAAGSMSRQQALTYVRRTVLYALAGLAPRMQAMIAAVLASAFREALRTHGHEVPPMEPPAPGSRERKPPFGQARMTAEWERDLADLLDNAGDHAAGAAEGALRQVAKAIEAAGAEPVNPYQAALDKALAQHGGFPGSTLSARRIRAAQTALDDLAERGITGFTDKAGRRWNLASYVEMATRTLVSNAWDDMQAKAAARAGIDLADTGTYSTEGSCPTCLPWLGRTISLTGTTPGYPTLEQAKAEGWRHPNCRCFFTPRGLSLMPEVTNPVDIAEAAAAYSASQRQRALERNVRRAGRAYESAITPKAKGNARRDLHAARNASEAHRVKHRVRMMKVSVHRREHAHNAR